MDFDVVKCLDCGKKLGEAYHWKILCKECLEKRECDLI